MKKIIMIILVIVFLLPTYVLLGSTSNNNLEPVYYKEIIISKGDTIFSISYNNNTSNLSNKKFMKYIMEFNGLKTDEIFYGNSIIVPMFDLNENLDYVKK